MSRALAARVQRLEHPAGEEGIQGWAARYGWPKVWAWQASAAARARHKLLPEHCPPAPEETQEETAFHVAMANKFPPDPADLDRLNDLLGVTR